MIDPLHFISELKELAKSYEPNLLEPAKLAQWQAASIYAQPSSSAPDFVVCLPPPNVTGDLHLGHALNATLQDLLLRYWRMKGKTVHWQTGCDHAGIGTQIVVEKELAKNGVTRQGLGRKAFEEKIWAWSSEHRGRIEQQLARLGVSADFSRSLFTMDPQYVSLVRSSFFQLFSEGLIYRGQRLVNWCPKCLTSLSDLEINHENRKASLSFLAYKIVGSSESLIVATSRPETIFADVAVAINPNDPEKAELIAKIKADEPVQLIIPLTDRKIPIVLSERVELGFGSGALKITPAHDFNDELIAAELGLKDSFNVLSPEGKLLESELVPTEFWGLDRFKARVKVLEALLQAEALEESRDYEQQAALHDRCGTVIEPYPSEQWFLRMPGLAKQALAALDEEKIRFHPARYADTYRAWLENVRDWCIGRQLWWGHRVPVWRKTLPDLSADSATNQIIFKLVRDEFRQLALNAGFQTKRAGDKYNSSLLAGQKTSNEYLFQFGDSEALVCLKQNDQALQDLLEEAGYTQEEDVLDTWFSSSLWAFAWTEELPAGEYFTQVLSTAREILNLWVSRMVFMTMYLRQGKLPFRDILIHPVLQTPDGKRMSKSKGNAIDPLVLVESYGADASRLWYAGLGVQGNQDVRFQGKREADGSWTSPILDRKRRFLNKLWNACKFVQFQLTNAGGLAEGDSLQALLADISAVPEGRGTSIKWLLESVFGQGKFFTGIERAITEYRFAEYISGIEDFLWNRFCDEYIELSKGYRHDPVLAGLAARAGYWVLEASLRALQPIVPLVAEELWQALTGSEHMLLNQTFPESLGVLGFGEDSERCEAALRAINSLRFFKQELLGLAPNFVGLETRVLGEMAACFGDAPVLDLAGYKAVSELAPLEFSLKLTNLELLIALPAQVNISERKESIAKRLLSKQKDREKLLIQVERLEARGGADLEALLAETRLALGDIEGQILSYREFLSELPPS